LEDIPSGAVKVKISSSPFFKHLVLPLFINGFISLGVFSPFLQIKTQTEGSPALPALPIYNESVQGEVTIYTLSLKHYLVYSYNTSWLASQDDDGEE